MSARLAEDGEANKIMLFASPSSFFSFFLFLTRVTQISIVVSARLAEDGEANNIMLFASPSIFFIFFYLFFNPGSLRFQQSCPLGLLRMGKLIT